MICKHRTDLGYVCLLCQEDHIKELQSKIKTLEADNKDLAECVEIGLKCEWALGDSLTTKFKETQRKIKERNE